MKIYKFKLIKLNFFCYIQTKYLQNSNLISIKTFKICLVLKKYYRQKKVKKNNFFMFCFNMENCKENQI